MKHHEPYDGIGDLLRSEKPQVVPPRGLETRILSSLESREHSRICRIWPWLIFPPAAAIGLLLLFQPFDRKSSPVTGIDMPRSEAMASRLPSVRFENPFERESLALRRDAQRAGRFLIHCLPSLGTP
jgi:hypothetical protein